MRSPVSAVARKYFIGVGICVFVLLGLGVRAFMRPSVLAQGWEPSIREFEEQDKVQPPKPGCIVFAGSSSFRFWDTLVSDRHIMTPSVRTGAALAR